MVVSEERGLPSQDHCPACGGRLLMRYGRDQREGPDYKWRCVGRCEKLWTDDLSMSRAPAKP
jgi:hypothetical protein